MSKAAQTVTLLIEFDTEQHNPPSEWDWPNVIDGQATFIKASGIKWLDGVEDLADEFAENGLGDLAEFLRENGVEQTRHYVNQVIAVVERGDDPFDPEGESLHNLEVARDRLNGA